MTTSDLGNIDLLINFYTAAVNGGGGYTLTSPCCSPVVLRPHVYILETSTTGSLSELLDPAVEEMPPCDRLL